MAKITITLETSTRKVGRSVKRLVQKFAADVEKAMKDKPDLQAAAFSLLARMSGQVFTRADWENGRDHDDQPEREPQPPSPDDAA